MSGRKRPVPIRWSWKSTPLSLIHIFHNDLGKLVCLRVHQHDVHAKGLVCELLAPADIFAPGVGTVSYTHLAESCISPLGIGGFTSMKALSTAQDPEAASLPFDARRRCV